MAATGVSPVHPSLSVLRKAVEDTYGAHLSQANVEAFAEDTLNGQLSVDTIRQLWGWRHSGYKTVRRSTLDVLARYVGEADWCAFVANSVKRLEQDSLLVGAFDGLSYKELHVGQRVSVSWQPDRTACFVYDGNGHFHIASVANSSLLREGDEFDCCMLVVGEPAFLSSLVHDGRNVGAYTIGRVNGLSAVSFEP